MNHTESRSCSPPGPCPASRRAFQLMEVLVGSCILAVVGIAVLGAQAQSAKEVQTISDFTLAFLLSQKVSEESIESTYENMHADEALDALSGVKGTIKERGHPLFRAVEDTDPPYGRLLEPDLAIESRDADLFRLYRDYQLALAVTSEPVSGLAGNPKYLQNVAVGLDWPGLEPSKRSFDFPVMIAKPVIVPRTVPPVAADLPGLDRSIKTALYPASPASDLTGAVSAAGGQLTVVRDLGSVVVVLQAAMDQINDLDDQIVTAAVAARAATWPNAVRQAAARALVARLYEKKAAIMLQALLYCREPAWRIATSFMGSSLGNPPRPPRALVYGLLTQGMRFPDNLAMATHLALENYVLARSGLPAAGPLPFWQLTIERKVLELGKIYNLLREERDVTFLTAWTSYLGSIYKNRNRFAQDHLDREKLVVRDLDSIQAAHLEIKNRLAEIAETLRAFRDLRSRVATELN